MASENGLSVRSLLKRGVVGYVVDDTPVAIRIRQTGGNAVTSVTVAGTSTTLVLIDADGTTSIALDASAYNTVGEVVDYLNAQTNWEAKHLDSLRSDSVNGTLLDAVVVASTVDGVTYYDLVFDTSLIKSYTYRLAINRHTSTSGMVRPKGSHRVSVIGIDYFADINAASADGVQIFETNPAGYTETQIMSKASINASDTAITFASGNGKITSQDNNDLVVRIYNSTTLTDHASGYLQVTGELE